MVTITMEIPSFLLEPLVWTLFAICMTSLLIVYSINVRGSLKRDRKTGSLLRKQEEIEKHSPSITNFTESDIVSTRRNEKTENSNNIDLQSKTWRRRASWYSNTKLLRISTHFSLTSLVDVPATCQSLLICAYMRALINFHYFANKLCFRKLLSAPTEICSPLQGIESTRLLLEKYLIDPITGFLPKDDPIERLPYERYHLWEDLVEDLPNLLSARLGQVRDPLRQLPIVDSKPLREHAELRRAHLILCLLAHAYVWGGKDPLDELPEGIAIPLWDVSKRLGIPPVLGHPSIVMYNYRRLDHQGEISMDNLCTLNNFFGGRDESWFYLVTVEIEARGAASIVPLMLIIDAIERSKNIFSETISAIAMNAEKRKLSCNLGVVGQEGGDLSDALTDDSDDRSDSDEEWTLNGFILKQTIRRRNRYNLLDSRKKETYSLTNAEINDDELTLPEVVSYVTSQLKIVNRSISGMIASLKSMREGCHPFIFFHRVRPFLSGWKSNPTLPNGILYKGVSNERMQFYGGSAAQSSMIPLLDIALGVTHDDPKSVEFLSAMRSYMIPAHKEFLCCLEMRANLREFVYKCVDNRLKGSQILKQAYDDCLLGLQEFRSCHISLVADYILAQQKKSTQGVMEGIEKSSGGKGTGGTDLMNFLKPIRDDCTKKLIDEKRPNYYRGPSPLSDASPSDAHVHSNISSKYSTNGTPSILDSRKFSDDEYFEDYCDPEDIDLYRGGHSTTSSSLSKIHEFKSKGISVLKDLSIKKLGHIIHYSSNAYYNRVPLLTDVEYDQVKDLQSRKIMMTPGKTKVSANNPKCSMMGRNLCTQGAYGTMPNSSDSRGDTYPFGGTGSKVTGGNGRIEEPGSPYIADKMSGTYQ